MRFLNLNPGMRSNSSYRLRWFTSRVCAKCGLQTHAADSSENQKSRVENTMRPTLEYFLKNLPSIADLYIETDRMRLDPIIEADYLEFHELFEDSRLHTYTNYKPLTLEERRAKCASWATRISPDGTELRLNWAARDKQSKKLVAHFQGGIPKTSKAVVGYLVAVDYHQKGLAFEGMSAVFNCLRKQFFIEAISAFVSPKNLASQKLALKLGMKSMGTQDRDPAMAAYSGSTDLEFCIKF